MEAGTKDMTVERGSCLPLTFRMKTSAGAIIPLTGYQGAEFEVKVNDKRILLVTNFTIAEADGEVSGTLTADETSLIPKGAYNCDYSVTLIQPGGCRQKVLKGHVAQLGLAAPGTVDTQMYKAFTYAALSGATPFGATTFASGNTPIIYVRVV